MMCPILKTLWQLTCRSLWFKRCGWLPYIRSYHSSVSNSRVTLLSSDNLILSFSHKLRFYRYCKYSLSIFWNLDSLDCRLIDNHTKINTNLYLEPIINVPNFWKVWCHVKYKQTDDLFQGSQMQNIEKISMPKINLGLNRR